MNIVFLVLLCAGLLGAGYFFYGRFLRRLFALDDRVKTPAREFKDGIDYEPTPKVYLLGQHLSAIAAAGPIVGPILAGLWFGWLPALIWIVLGGIFIGGVHDMASLVASLRHRGQSIAEVLRACMGQRAYILFLLFLWFSLVYIITAFTDITASTFVDLERGPAVASSSMMYLTLAILMGFVLKKFNPPLIVSTVVFMPLVLVCIWLGPFFPLNIPPIFGLDLRATWDVLILVYCYFASIIPVWLLLQPRGYLGGFFLTLTTVVSFIGLLIGGLFNKFALNFPAFTGWSSPLGLPLFPLLFVTVACGACSGFHAIVSSGTTAKQIDKESDARAVGYGGMLLESFVAIIALCTLIIISRSDAGKLADPNQIYANGIAAFLGSLGIERGWALNFALLAFATFVYDTLDVATRLGRYVSHELTGWRGKLSPFVLTFATLIIPLIFVTRKVVDANGNAVPGWKIFWSVFGSSNQLLASLVLLGVSVWMMRSGKKFWVALAPALFMTLVAVYSLVLIIKPWLGGIIIGKPVFDPISLTAVVLLFLAGMLAIEGVKAMRQIRSSQGKETT